MTLFKGILFDFDGTLADTMEGHYLAWMAALNDRGVSVEPAEYYPLEGMGLHEIAKRLTRELPWTEDEIDELVQRKKKYYIKRQSVRFYPGVESLICQLREQKVPIAIVTAGHLDQLCSFVPYKFLNQFSALITGDLVLNGKPDPESYTQGAKALGLDAKECIAVENSPLGVQSAKRAGAYCLAISSTVEQAELEEADEVLDSFENLRNNRFFGQVLWGKNGNSK